MGNDIVKFEETFALAKMSEETVKEVIDANLAGQNIDLGILDRIKMPSGGMVQWIVPTLENGDVPVPTLRVVIIHHKLARAMWKVSLDESGGGTPPDCSSPDNLLGYGDPGDSLRAEGKGCAECPLSQWQSDFGGGKGKQCKEMHMMFVVDEEELLPKALVLPPSSLKAATQFMWRLSSKARPFYSIVVEIGLEKVVGQGVPDHARAVFRVVGTLDDDQTRKLRDMKNRLTPIFDRAQVVDASADIRVPDADPAAPPPPTSTEQAAQAIPDDADQPLT